MTIQDPEVFLYHGRKLFTEDTPLEMLPAEVGFKPESIWTSNWRGYVGTWKVEDQKLYLVKLDVQGGDSGAVYELIGRYGGKVFAEWYSGTIDAAESTRQGLIKTTRDQEDVFLSIRKGVVEQEKYTRIDCGVSKIKREKLL